MSAALGTPVFIANFEVMKIGRRYCYDFLLYEHIFGKPRETYRKMLLCLTQITSAAATKC